MSKPRSSTRPAPAPGRQSVRLIAGRWRGRRLAFPDIEGLRPTPDRVRETVFNWLQGHCAGARVLDLFAGSGALGLEALSRGAAEAVLVERHPAAVRQLRILLSTLGVGPAGANDSAGGPAARVVAGDGYRHLEGPVEPFDLVFLDPPFADGREVELCKLIVERGWLVPGGWLYVEHPAARAIAAWPTGLRPWREGRAGDVTFRLLHLETGPP